MSKLRVGFATIYSWRPHVEHMFFLSEIAKNEGCETFFLTCDANLPTCYNIELRNQPKIKSCLLCRLGGIRSFTKENISSIGELNKKSANHEEKGITNLAYEWVKSSSSTLGRFESTDDFDSTEYHQLIQRLQPSAIIAYNATIQWIEKEKLDAIIIFNGRMDVTRAVFEAAKHKNIRIISQERTWYSHGLQLYPNENCLGLQNVNKFVNHWKDLPLKKEQAIIAASYIASRFLHTNNTEWRAYNTKPEYKSWPLSGKKRVLIIPSSHNEVAGHPDWKSSWDHPTDGFTSVINQLNLTPNDIILRCHPNWSEKIGKNDGSLAEAFYKKWANSKNIYTISSSDKTSTSHLIKQCDIVLLGHGSAAVEAGLLGKTIISISPSIYQKAGFCTLAFSHDEVKNINIIKLSKTEIIRQTLRFLYTMNNRIPQYVNEVRAETTTSYNYHQIKNSKLSTLIESLTLKADDATYSENTESENAIIHQIENELWQNLPSLHHKKPGSFLIKRRSIFKYTDTIRSFFKNGDR